ncbi:uncharacterized protein LOC106641341 [Copidosoma floridanum]|uniref:uncharacterized protein LOC106641341 n=1 Tax=Copidosoma floridanum TaxID=29053 RepID=UPI000C6FAAA4|nr:uncharacterized protein LOC106641341 [Copidosoma floridanum]
MFLDDPALSIESSENLASLFKDDHSSIFRDSNEDESDMFPKYKHTAEQYLHLENKKLALLEENLDRSEKIQTKSNQNACSNLLKFFETLIEHLIKKLLREAQQTAPTKSDDAPGRSGKEVLIGEVDIAMRSDVDNEYGATSPQPFDKKCLVDGNVYTHSQMIPSRDQSSHCLCVAGEVYCWWQTFGSPKALSAFAPDSSFSSKLDNSINNNENRNNKNNVNDGGIELSDNEGRPDPGTTEEDYSSEVPPEASEESSGDQLDDNNVESDEQSDIIGDDEDDDEYEGEEEEEEEEDQESNDVRQAVPAAMNATTMSSLTTTSAARPTKAPEPCLFMGRAYQEGEMLPHSTGNCVECRCGTGARIECSPRDCVGLRPQRPGGGDLEFFDGGNTF